MGRLALGLVLACCWACDPCHASHEVVSYHEGEYDAACHIGTWTSPISTVSTGYQRSSRDAYLQRLRARRLVLDAGRGKIRATEELFG